MRRKYRRGIDMVDKLNRYISLGLLLMVMITMSVPGALAAGHPSNMPPPTSEAQIQSDCAKCHDVATKCSSCHAYPTFGPAPSPVPSPVPKLSITVPKDIITTATGTNTLVDLGTAKTSGGKAPVSITNDVPTKGFPVGINTVTWTATDSTGAKATGTQKVTITEGNPEPPVSTDNNLTIDAPENITMVATGEFTHIEDLGTPNVTGGTPPYTITNNSPIGNNFTVGDTIVTWNVTDSNGTNATDIQKVTITTKALVPVPGPLPPETGPLPPETEQTGEGKISGKVFNDINKDEDKDKSEPGIVDVGIKLRGVSEEAKGIKLETDTDKKGKYTFEDLPDGKYVLSVKFKKGWVHTSHINKKVTIKDGNVVKENFGKMKKNVKKDKDQEK